MFFIDNRLWYLGNRTPGPGRSRIISYNLDDKSIIFYLDFSILDAKGLSIDEDDIFTTYENNSHSLISFRIDTSTYVANNIYMPRNYQLKQNFPNPFNHVTKICFHLYSPNRVSLKIFNNQGKIVKTLIDDMYWPTGEHLIEWNGLDDDYREVSSGIYICCLTINSLSRQSRNIILTK
jgi:hypothetical protein